MSESTGTTQPVRAAQPVSTQDPAGTQEINRGGGQKKPRRFLGFLLNVLIFLLIIGLGIFGGYQSGIIIRINAQKSLNTQQLSDQFTRAIVDIQFGNYEAAKTRLEYIIGIDPSYPGAMEKLTEVLVLSSIPTATPVVSPTPELIMDDTNYEGLLAQAQQLIAAGQWQNAMTVLGTMRKQDAAFRTVQVDGMYYFALRNLGVDFVKAGNLEGGIYELTLAENFAPLDNTAHFLRDNARVYISAASFWELDWQRAAENFYYLNGSGIWDGTMTATERYRIAAMRYGDELFGRGDYCGADEWYQGAESAGGLENGSIGNAREANAICYPPTGTIAPTSQATATTDTSVAPTNTPAPTDTPVPPTETPIPPDS